SVFVEALRPLPIRRLGVFAGGTIGYLRAEIGGVGPERTPTATLEIDQVPVLALARARMPLSARLEMSGELAAGMMAARTRLTTLSSGQGFDASGSAYAPALGVGGDVGLTLKPGRLVIGLRYLWSRLGQTSQGDQITGNSAGLIGDIGYRMTF